MVALSLPSTAPLSYTVPAFPSLYWPVNATPGQSYYLYFARDIWRFVLYWTLLTYGATHIAAASYATLIQLAQNHRHKHRLSALEKVKVGVTIWGTYLVIGGIEALFAGSVVGLILGAVYQAGYFHMSTWIPFIWALVNVLVLILSAYSIQGGL